MDGVNEDKEEFPGNFILYNKDDDNDNGVPDYDDTDNTAEDDLVKIILHWVEPAHCYYAPQYSITGTVTFNVTSGASKVKVWKAHPSYPTVNKLKYEQISFSPPPVYNTPYDLPKVFYVEGIEESDAREVEFTLTYNELGFKDKVKVTVVEVDILEPEGSLDAVKNHESSWLMSAPYRFDFQGLISTATGPYVLDIEGDINPAPPVGYKWTLDAAAGTLTDDTTDDPTHIAPDTQGQGMLTLKAMIDTTDTGLKDERKVKIYMDHLARDYANFETGGYCINDWEITTFNVDPHPIMDDWNCHGATRHAYNGTYSDSYTSQPWLSWDVKTVVVTYHVSSGNGSHPALGTLERGDVVAYFSPSGKPYDPPDIGDLSSWTMQHSQTCTGSGDETYGANNEPKTYPGAPGEGQSWKWATSPAGDWGIHIWQPSLQGSYVPFIIVVFDKP
jgi:hypothetical protein